MALCFCSLTLHMKIVTWNCNMAFRKKAEVILKHKPDILIVPECEHPDKLLFKTKSTTASDALWFGHNHHKGLGIFSYCDFRFSILDCYNEDFKLVIPISVSNKQFEFTLFAIWANNPKDPDGQYVTQVWKAIHYYKHLLTDKNIILIGDFNSNTIWDKPKRIGNHSTLVDTLASKGIYSTYHNYFTQEQGKEKHPTLYMYRHKDKPYHIDYCFASANMMKQLKTVQIGSYRKWAKYSDHVPVIITFENLISKNENHRNDNAC